MRSFEIPSSKAKLKLLDSAELLVSQKGFDAVSVRDVTQLAKANVAAINYHFGSREGMLAMMMVRRMSPIHEEQLKRLDLLEKKRGNKTVPLEELLGAWLGPLFSENSKSEAKAMVARLSVARILRLSVEHLPQPLQDSGSELWHRYLKAFGKSLKDVSKEELVWRLHLLNGAAIQALIGTASIEAWVGKKPASSESSGPYSLMLQLAAAMLREGGIAPADEEKSKGPQETFDF